jgi:hypothetical protein
MTVLLLLLLMIDPYRAEHGIPWVHQTGPYTTEICAGDMKSSGVRACQYYTTLLALRWVEEESAQDWPELSVAIFDALRAHPMPVNSRTGEGISAAKTRLRKDVARELHPFFIQWNPGLGYPDWPDTASLALKLLQAN